LVAHALSSLIAGAVGVEFRFAIDFMRRPIAQILSRSDGNSNRINSLGFSEPNKQFLVNSVPHFAEVQGDRSLSRIPAKDLLWPPTGEAFFSPELLRILKLDFEFEIV
jgi:hypothetical protein